MTGFAHCVVASKVLLITSKGFHASFGCNSSRRWNLFDAEIAYANVLNVSCNIIALNHIGKLLFLRVLI